MKTENALFLKCKDHSISGHEFDLMYDPEFELLRTFPVPSDLASYYKSDSYISHTDRKASIFERVYHLVRRYTINKKLKYIGTYHPNKGSLMDVGAGTGEFLLAAKDAGWQVAGVEPEPTAKQNAARKGLLLATDFNSIQNKKFDVITLWHVLEHVKDIDDEIDTLKNYLDKNGTLFVAVPNFKSFDAAYYKQYWAAYDVPRHLWHFSQTAIKRIFENHQMKLIKTIPMKFDAFYVSLLSEKYKSGSMNPFRAFYIASRSNWKAFHSKEYSSLIYVLKRA